MIVRYKDISLQRFERLLVLAPAHSCPRKGMYWTCLCDCGAECVVLGQMLRNGHTKSCGCYGKDLRSVGTALASMKHGHRVRGATTPTWQSWWSATRRCTDPTFKSYADYGGRGITICNRWYEFTAFLEDMGERPARTTLDRKEVNGNYEPGNCRWATYLEQRANRRDSVR